MGNTAVLRFVACAAMGLLASACRTNDSPSPESRANQPDSPEAVAALDALGADLERNASHQVTKVDLAYCQVDGAAIERLADLPALEWLVLDGTQVSDELVAALADCRGLQTLYLAGTPITDRGLVGIARLNGLQRLQLSGTKVSDQGLAHLGNLSNLKSIWLHNTSVSKRGIADLQRELPDLQIEH